MKKYLIAALIVMVFYACVPRQEFREGQFNPEADFKKADKLIEDKNFEDARRLLDDIRVRDNTGLYAPLAQLRSADSYVAEQEPETAVEEFRRFLQFYPGHKYSAYAQYRIAIIYYEQITDFERGYWAALSATNEFETLNLQHPRNPYKEIADQKIEICRNIIAENEYSVGNFYFKKKAYKGALSRLLGLINNYSSSEREPDALYRIAMSFKATAQIAQAKEYYNILVNKYPGTKAAGLARKEFGN